MQNWAAQDPERDNRIRAMNEGLAELLFQQNLTQMDAHLLCIETQT